MSMLLSICITAVLFLGGVYIACVPIGGTSFALWNSKQKTPAGPRTPVG